MTSQAGVQPSETLIDRAVDGSGARIRRLGTNLGARIIETLTVCGKAWAAAGLYEELSRLSDAELDRRGMTRGELHRCVFEELGFHPCKSNKATNMVLPTPPRCGQHR